jgi:hypothetical protein
MGESWIHFVMRIKKDENLGSLKDAMVEAGKRKSEWKKDEKDVGGKKGGGKRKGGASKKKSKKSRKNKKTKKSRKSSK